MIKIMKTSFSMLFYMKKQKNYDVGPAPIYLRITVDGMRSEITTGRECDPLRWNNKSGRATGTKADIRNFNAHLDNLQSKVYKHIYGFPEGMQLPLTFRKFLKK
jgi:hypothetical protein